VRVLALLSQVAAVVLVALVVLLLGLELASAMQRRNLSLDPAVLGRTASFEIAESFLAYAPTDSYGQALLVGLANTVIISVLGIILSTGLGLLLGIARLSHNWLLNRIAATYVEVFRNTPLLVQLFFIYFAVLLRLPPVRDTIAVGESILLNQRGLYLPRPEPVASFVPWLAVCLAGVGIALLAWGISSRRAAAGRPTHRIGSLGTIVLLAAPLVGWLVLGAPFGFELPGATRFNVQGGLRLSSEFLALLLGLVLYTAAFIAEVVRGGIQAVPRGQLEAARALGLREGQTLRLVLLPQAMRIIVPPLTSQYLNLAKNSSLAIAIGYPDLFNVASTTANQTGQPVLVIVTVMGAYLAMSLLTSLLMNIYNRRVQLKER
jgi:general L-amino acid transport system permease protein